MKQAALSNIPDLDVSIGEPNASGILQLRVVPALMLTMLKPDRVPPYVSTSTYTLTTDNLFFTDDAQLVTIGVLPDYATFTDNMEETPNGNLFRPTISIVIPKLRPEVTGWIDQYKGVRWVAFLQDRNGFCRCVGTPDEPLSISVSQSAGQGSKGQNMALLTFSGSCQQSAYYINSIQDDALSLNEVDFDSSFGIEFNS